MSEKPSFFFTVPARNPRTLCCCQSVACIISSMLAPSGWLSRVSTRSCLVTRSTFGSSAFTGVLAAATRSAFDSTDRVGFLALAAGDVTLRRDAVFDWALPFLGAALFVFRDFMERVDIVWAPLVRGQAQDCQMRGGQRTNRHGSNPTAAPLLFDRALLRARQDRARRIGGPRSSCSIGSPKTWRSGCRGDAGFFRRRRNLDAGRIVAKAGGRSFQIHRPHRCAMKRKRCGLRRNRSILRSPRSPFSLSMICPACSRRSGARCGRTGCCWRR